jgi:hypothetical protein
MSEVQTKEHIKQVQLLISKVIEELEIRKLNHDKSKLEEPEKSIFDIYTSKLKGTTYNSKEYKQYLKEMKPALDHHYANNRHHPEYFSRIYICTNCRTKYIHLPTECETCCHTESFERVNDVSEMNLIDIIEMICDWKAATLRHDDGDINKSIEINQKRFNYSDDIKQIFQNTVDQVLI